MLVSGQNVMIDNESKTKENLIIITNYAPDEIYLSNEIRFLSKKYNIYFFRKEDNNYQNKLVQDTESVKTFTLSSNMYKGLVFVFNILLQFFSADFWRELIYIFKSRKASILSIKQALWYSLTSNSNSNEIIKRLHDENVSTANCTLYSYRADSGALTILKVKEKLNDETIKCVARAHAIDLYEKRAQQEYIPFRKKIYNELSKLYLISENGKKHVEELPFDNCPLQVAYLGTKDCGPECYTKYTALRIVSCSRIDPIKRIDKMMEALSGITDIDIIWTHVGGGEGLELLADKAEHMMPPNIKVTFAGNMNNNKLMEFYKNSCFDCFINTSYDEGLPVSIMEACSFGIPVIATDVGGTSEIVVNGKNGFLVERDFANESLRTVICNFYNASDEKTLDMRHEARNIWEHKFNQNINYAAFAENL